jgi:[protein-PII] uridylyltransferase
VSPDWPILGGVMTAPASAAAPPGQRLRRGTSRQARLRARVETLLQRWASSEISAEEVDAHFQGMPARYWSGADADGVIGDLQAVHAFLTRLAGSQSADAPIAVDWMHEPARGTTLVRVCTWDRTGLLAKMAAAFSALRLNIREAAAFTRADHLVLDVFRVSDVAGKPVMDEDKLRQFVFLLEGALAEPPRFASVWAAQFHRVLARSDRLPPRIIFDNTASPAHTVLKVEASDRLGLLYDLLLALTDCGLNITQAAVETEAGIARDTFHLTGPKGEKVATHSLPRIREALEQALGV